MKSPTEFLIGILFTVTSMIFWYGGYAILFTERAIARYWWVFVACALAYILGRVSV